MKKMFLLLSIYVFIFRVDYHQGVKSKSFVLVWLYWKVSDDKNVDWQNLNISNKHVLG